MKITRIVVNNYRLLKDFSIELEDDLSLVIGKNNTGKTSLLSVLNKFLNGSAGSFSLNDFNLKYKDELKSNIIGASTSLNSGSGITMNLYIQYNKKDDLSNIERLMMDLDPENNIILLSFEYIITPDNLSKLRSDFSNFQLKEKLKIEKAPLPKPKARDLDYFLKENFAKYFFLLKKTVDTKDETKFIDLDKEKISLKDIISYKLIKANRDVSNKEPDKSLSVLSAKIYEELEKDEAHLSKIDEFKETLRNTDESLGDTYDNIFKDTIDQVKKFGGIKPNETEIQITSTLQHKELLKGNTTVMYAHNGSNLPESYNGLGYMNLISMIFELQILIYDFKKSGTEKPADINLLFIEEPEAHTHPQMQYVFIKNIKDLLQDCIRRDDGQNRSLQTIISTHSSCIVAESNFNDIKYLQRNNDTVVAKNMKDLKNYYSESDSKDVGSGTGNKTKNNSYKFLKQYLTLHRAELFFADKAIFIEGDTERILLPAMMKKIDLEIPETPLLSQNISIIEVGNYSHIFAPFIDFIGIKSLIITDIDSAMTKEKQEELKGLQNDDEAKRKIKQKVMAQDPNATITTNSSLKFFYGNDIVLDDLKTKKIEDLILRKDTNDDKWLSDANGYLLCAYQTKEKEYHASSFEDAFFNLNRQFIIENKEAFKSLVNIDNFEKKDNEEIIDNTYIYNPYELAEKCIEKKPPFAIEILLNSDEKFSNWEIPDYIKKGLLWLKKDQL